MSRKEGQRAQEKGTQGSHVLRQHVEGRKRLARAFLKLTHPSPLLLSHPPRPEADDLARAAVSVSGTGLLYSAFQILHLHFLTGIEEIATLPFAGCVVTSPVTTHLEIGCYQKATASLGVITQPPLLHLFLNTGRQVLCLFFLQ